MAGDEEHRVWTQKELDSSPPLSLKSYKLLTVDPSFDCLRSVSALMWDACVWGETVNNIHCSGIDQSQVQGLVQQRSQGTLTQVWSRRESLSVSTALFVLNFIFLRLQTEIMRQPVFKFQEYSNTRWWCSSYVKIWQKKIAQSSSFLSRWFCLKPWETILTSPHCLYYPSSCEDGGVAVY